MNCALSTICLVQDQYGLAQLIWLAWLTFLTDGWILGHHAWFWYTWQHMQPARLLSPDEKDAQVCWLRP